MTPPGFQVFESGPIQVWFDAQAGSLRRITFHGHEVIRAIYFLSRAPNWSTRIPEISGIVSKRTDTGFSIEWQASVPGELSWTAAVTATPTTLHVAFRCTPATDLSTNRTGICLLHPAHVARKSVTVGHPDGKSTSARFPSSLVSTAVFEDVQSLALEPWSGASVAAELSGDVFETEDQRNFGDGSYKTYNRPRTMPQPYTLPRGEAFEQSVGITFAGGSPQAAPFETQFERLGEWRGVGLIVSDGVLPPDTAEKLAPLRLTHLVATAASKASAIELGAKLRIPVDLILRRDERDRVAQILEGMNVRSVLVPGDQHPGNRPREGLGLVASYPGTFQALNTGRPAMASYDGLAFGFQPQVHQTDDLTILESLEVPRLQAAQAKTLSAGKPVAACPITWNSSGSAPDPRLDQPFAAAWTVATALGFAIGGASEIVIHRTHGPHGVTERASLLHAFECLAGLRAGPMRCVARADGPAWVVRSQLGTLRVNAAPWPQTIGGETLEPHHLTYASER